MLTTTIIDAAHPQHPAYVAAYTADLYSTYALTADGSTDSFDVAAEALHSLSQRDAYGYTAVIMPALCAASNQYFFYVVTLAGE